MIGRLSSVSNSKTEAKKCRRSCHRIASTPAASQAGFNPRLRKLETLLSPPVVDGNTRSLDGVLDRLGQLPRAQVRQAACLRSQPADVLPSVFGSPIEPIFFDRFVDAHQTGIEVDVVPSKRELLAGAQPGVGRKRDCQAIARRCVRNDSS
jgi:hypothetical protein